MGCEEVVADTADDSGENDDAAAAAAALGHVEMTPEEVDRLLAPVPMPAEAEPGDGSAR